VETNRGGVRVDPDEFEALPLRAHDLLADVPLHDVWRLELAGGRPGLGVPELRELLASSAPGTASPAVRLLFALRRGLGRLFGWDRESPGDAASSFRKRLSAEDFRDSLVPPGTREGPFQVLFVSRREAISEIRNATVHAFSVQALFEEPRAYRLYWAIYVLPVGRITAWYMRAIDPFRRAIVYPAVLRRMQSAWEASALAAAGDVVASPRARPGDPEAGAPG
jgi:hypothetical protein